jgi:hypothetical protein
VQKQAVIDLREDTAVERPFQIGDGLIHRHRGGLEMAQLTHGHVRPEPLGQRPALVHLEVEVGKIAVLDEQKVGVELPEGFGKVGHVRLNSVDEIPRSQEHAITSQPIPEPGG